MPISIVTICGLILGAAQWSALAGRHSAIFPVLEREFFSDGPGGADERAKQMELSERLGLHKTWSIPMYHRHLVEKPKSIHIVWILNTVRDMNLHAKLFVPFAVRRLDDATCRHDAIFYIKDFGDRGDAKAVASLLLTQKLDNGTVINILDCVKKIGGVAEVDILRQFAVKSTSEDPKHGWALEVDPRIEAIEARLEAEAKAAALEK